jgi:antitoxin (DNA-binding transcriptional repressor) of toxin-antitoxin stability system
VESVGVGRARRDLYEILREVEGGAHYLLLRFDRPIAAVISQADYLAARGGTPPAPSGGRVH